MEELKKKRSMYQVEAIVNHRYNSFGKLEYLVKWEGYPSSQNTWEPKKHLLHLTKMIKDYEDSVGSDAFKKLKKGSLFINPPDIPKQIINIKSIEGKGRFCKIKWKKRKNNAIPTSTYVSYEIIKKQFPELLYEFLEPKIEFVKIANERVINLNEE